MANRVKEDEKNERIIRNLLKLPENRRCINCNSLGPQYVCTNFWTFVCTNCSGMHREFTHRVKSISLAKFTSQEVSALQGGGNARAKEIYLKEWDPQRHSAPDSSNVERLRDFIKHVYVDRRYTGERSFDKPPRVKMGDVEDSYENRRTDAYRGGSRSPPYEHTHERRYSDRPSPGGRSDDKNYRNSYGERSPGYDQENRQYGDYRRSPARTEILNDWGRDDRAGNGRRSEDSRISEGASKLEVRSPDSQKDQDMSSPPMVRPVRDILGDNISPLRVIEPPKVNDGRATEVSARTQRTASSNSLASSNDNPTETKKENLGSLIDFDAVPEPPVTTPVLQTQQPAIDHSFLQPTAPSNGENWACFDSTTEMKVSQVTTNANSLESVLSQLSAPTSGPGHVAGVPSSSVASVTTPVDMMSGIPSFTNSTVAPLGHTVLSAFGSGAPSAAPVNNYMNFPDAGAPPAVSVGHMSASSFVGSAPAPAPTNNVPSFAASAAVPGSALALPTNGGQWSGMQPQQNSLFPAPGIQPTAQVSTPPLGGPPSSQPWNSSVAPNTQGLSSGTAASKPMHDTASVTGAQPSNVPGGRKELPADLFTATYRPVSVPLTGWQPGPPHGFGFAMPYNAAVPMPNFPQSSKSTNPFDLSSDASPVQAQMFPSMASLQGALPNMAASSGLLRTSSLNTPSPTLMPPHSLYPSAMPHQAPSYASTMPPGASMGQQISSNLPSRHQAGMGLGTGGPAFGSLSANQQLGGIYSAPATPNAFSSVGGNPFG